jgi:hypothetical protein
MDGRRRRRSRIYDYKRVLESEEKRGKVISSRFGTDGD